MPKAAAGLRGDLNNRPLILYSSLELVRGWGERFLLSSALAPFHPCLRPPTECTFHRLSSLWGGSLRSARQEGGTQRCSDLSKPCLSQTQTSDLPDSAPGFPAVEEDEGREVRVSPTQIQEPKERNTSLKLAWRPFPPQTPSLSLVLPSLTRKIVSPSTSSFSVPTPTSVKP